MSGSGTTIDRVRRALRFAGAALYPGEFGALADWRAIAAGVAVQATITAAVFLAGVSYWLVAGAVVAGAAVAGGLSRTFESEYIDGAGATAMGSVLTLVLFLGYVWVLSWGFAPIWQANFVWLGGIFGGFAVFVVLPFVCMAGAIVGHWAALVRRTYLA